MAQPESLRVEHCVHLHQTAREPKRHSDQQHKHPVVIPVDSVCSRVEIHGKCCKASLWTFSVQNMRLLKTQRDLTLLCARAIGITSTNFKLNFREDVNSLALIQVSVSQKSKHASDYRKQNSEQRVIRTQYRSQRQSEHACLIGPRQNPSTVKSKCMLNELK